MAHLCHATGCETAVPPRMFMCKKDWYRLPKAMRDAIWDAYRPGQEVTKTPSREYLRVAREAISYLERADAFEAIQARDGLPCPQTGLTHCRTCHGVDGDPHGPRCGHYAGCPEC